MSERPLVSVVIATYYRNELVEDAIESVLEQEYAPVEVIVVDDSGCANARSVLSAYDDVTAIYRSENGGWGRAYTDGIQAANGKYIQLLDDDDYLLSGKLERSVTYLEANPTIGVVYTGLVQDATGEERPDPAYTGSVLEQTLGFRTFPCCTLTMTMRRSVLGECLPLSDEADDMHLKIELAQRTRFGAIDACLAYRRSRTSRKWVGMDRVAEMRRILRIHADCYEDYPMIRQAVRAEIEVREGTYHLEHSWWSPRAIKCFARAAWFDPDGRFRNLSRAICALFGRPGLSFARWGYNQIPPTNPRLSPEEGIDG